MRRLRRAVALGVVALCGLAAPAVARQVVVLGIDGMDPELLQEYVRAGRMPHFARLVAAGGFRPLATAAVAESPVAWSTFSTGLDPGGHGIFGFVHRDPHSLLPFLSTSRTIAGGRQLALGSFVLPLARARVELLRHGRTFWEVLGEHGVPSTIWRMPANFPPAPAPHSRQLAGMGTPDLLGTPGTFAVFGEREPELAGALTGGRFVPVHSVGDRVELRLQGPSNPYRRVRTGDGEYAPASTDAVVQVELDRQAAAARLRVGDTQLVLGQGEWSDWVRVDFEFVPGLAGTSGLARFHLQTVDPVFRIYVSPLQINPEDPATPISSPPEWARQLWSDLGYFGTQGMPEETNGYLHGLLSGEEFVAQVMLTHQESRRIHRWLQSQQQDGLLFMYYGTIDQGCHMLWHHQDPRHPHYQPDSPLADAIGQLYEQMDAMLGETLASLPADATLIVLSDHGFAPFYWTVDLNTWLLEAGYVQLRDPAAQERTQLFDNVDWSRTTAYALGLNGVFVNLRGREREGIVAPGEEYEQLLDRLEGDLRALTDPRTGMAPVSAVTRPAAAFHGPYAAAGPDLLVGYRRGYRSSWESPLGAFPASVFADNDRAWSGDHCMDPRLVPGVLLANRQIVVDRPGLADLTVAILDEWGIPPLPEMTGRDCLGGPLPDPDLTPAADP